MLSRINFTAKRSSAKLLCTVLVIAAALLSLAEAALAASGDTPVLVATASRKQHATAGSFDLPLSLTASNPTIEPRSGPTQTLVFFFDKAVAAGVAVVTEGTATAGDPMFSGNEMIVPLTGVADRQYVSVAVTRVLAFDGGTAGRGSARIGLLRGDVSQNRVVTLSDLEQVHARLAQPVAAANYLQDVDTSGTLTTADEALVNAQLTMLLPAPPVPANQPPVVSAGTSQTVVLPASASLAGSVGDDGLPNPPGAVTLGWSKVSGPGTVTFTNPLTTSASATFSAFGTYVLRLAATDGGLSNFADVTVNATSVSADTMVLTATGLPAPIDILTFHHGATATQSFSVVGGGAGKVSVGDASFTALESANMPLQFSRLAAGTHVIQAVLEVRSAATATLLSDWKFEDVQLTSLFTSASGQTSPTSSFSIAFARFTYRTFNTNGTVAARMCFDIQMNLAC